MHWVSLHPYSAILRCNHKLFIAVINQRKYLTTFSLDRLPQEFFRVLTHYNIAEMKFSWYIRHWREASSMALMEQLLYNKSSRDGKLFPLEVKRQSIIIKRDSFVLRLFSDAKVESKTIRVIGDLCKLLVSEIKRKICVSNWANKQFVTERHAAELDYERRDMCKGKVRQCCWIRPVASSEAMRIYQRLKLTSEADMSLRKNFSWRKTT